MTTKKNKNKTAAQEEKKMPAAGKKKKRRWMFESDSESSTTTKNEKNKIRLQRIFDAKAKAEDKKQEGSSAAGRAKIPLWVEVVKRHAK